MQDNKNSLVQLGFLIVILLALGLAFMHISGRNNGGETSFRSAGSDGRPSHAGAYRDEWGNLRLEDRAVQALKNEELLGVPAEEAYEPLSKEQKRALAVQRYARRPDLSLRPSGGDSSRPGRYSGGYEKTGGENYHPSGSYLAGRQTYAGGANSSSYSGAYSGNYDGKGKNIRGSVVSSGGKEMAGVYRPSAEEKRQGVLAPYLTSLTPEQAKSLERQLTGLSSRVERGILQAMLPKSRKNANIEKYLQRNSSHNVSAGPFASVLEQVAAQKAGIMNSMNGAFGEEAAKEAGKVMDAYQSELAAALNQPGQTADQLTQKARTIGQKYEKELQEVGQKHGKKQFEAQRLEKDNALQEGLARAYGDNIASLAGELLADYREKDLQLAMAGLPEEEYYKRQLENQRARRKDLEQILLQNGKSLKGLQDAEDELERQRVAQAVKDEEEGKTLPTIHHYDDKTIQTVTADVRRERNEKQALAANIYGEEGGSAVGAIYDRYEARISEILNSDWPLSVKEQQKMEARRQANEEIESLQKSPQMREARQREQVEDQLERLMQDPGVRNASPAEKAAFEERARPVLDNMFRRLNEIAESDAPDDVKQKQMAAVQDWAQRQLSGGR